MLNPVSPSSESPSLGVVWQLLTHIFYYILITFHEMNKIASDPPETVSSMGQ